MKANLLSSQFSVTQYPTKSLNKMAQQNQVAQKSNFRLSGVAQA